MNAIVPLNPAPGTEYFGTIDGVGDRFRIVLNEQEITSDSITVTAMHMYLIGPTAIGDVFVGQSHCDIVATSPNQAPVAEDDAFTVEGGTQLEVAAPGLLENDSDPDNDPLTAQIHATEVTNFPAHGTLNLNADGSFTYLPEFGFEGDDTFTYIARDPRGANDTATVTITVTPSTGTLDNDDFADAMVLSGESGFVSAPDNTNATTEEDEPPVGSRSIWFQWTTPGAGAATFDTCGTNFSHLMAIYTGETLDTLQEVALSPFNVECPDGSPGVRLTFDASAGTTYYIVVAAADESSTGSTALQWSIVPAPPNDDFADAEVISGPSGSVNGTNVAATSEENEFLSAASIWYRWTAPEDGLYAFTTCGSDFQTTLGVFTGESIFPFTEIPPLGSAYPPPDCPESRASHQFRATAGTSYNIVVGGANAPPETGNVVLSWTQLPQAPNDDFADAQVISGPSGSVTGSHGLDSLASAEPGELNHANQEPHYSIWYSWTAPSDGEVTFDTCDSTFDTILAVYTGPTLDALTEVPANDDGCESGTGSRVTFVAAAGTTYHLATGANFKGEFGTLTLEWTSQTTPTTSTTTTTTTPTRMCGRLVATILGTNAGETIFGTRGRDVIAAGGGNDTVYGLGGDDVICGEAGHDTISGDSGNDVIRAGGGDDTVNGGGGDDGITGGPDDDSINGNDGVDRILGNEGRDTASGGAGDDIVSGNEDNDALNGGAGNDHVEGNAGDDRVIGNVGNDSLAGDAGADTVDARDGVTSADTLNGGPDPDRCFSDAPDTPPNLSGVDC